MVKEKERDHHHHHSSNNKMNRQEKKIMVNFIHCADIKFLLVTLLLVFFFLLTTFQYLSTFKHSPISSLPTKSLSQKTQQNPYDTFAIKRDFKSIGSAAYLFIQMGAYRGGLNTFSIIGLASKPTIVFLKPRFECHWIPRSNPSNKVIASSYKMLPDWGYGRVYTVLVLNCTFATDVGADSSGGELLITVTSKGGDEEKFLALEELPGTLNMKLFSSRPEYDYLYCGSPLYGNLSPQRIREWIAYHVKLFGDKSHFVIHDAGGVHLEVVEVLRPWIERGFVTLQDVRDQEKFDGYYHNQFLVVNDCLHRYRYSAKWMFFFDVDEYIYIAPTMKINALMDSMMEYTQFTIEQIPMSSKLCLSSDAGKLGRMWGIEKLVYKDVKRGIRRDRKYAIQPRNAFSVGIHLSQNFAGKTTGKTEGKIKYFHYHGTIATRRETCREFANATELQYEGTPFHRDEALRILADSVKRFEIKIIGSRLKRTRQ